jgi:hypothetical protein
MIGGLLEVRTHGAGIPTRQQAFFMWIVAAIARNAAVLVQGDGPGRSLGNARDLQELRKGQTHLGLHFIRRHILQHIGRRGRGHVPGDGMALGYDMTIPAQRTGLGTEAVGSTVAWRRIRGRYVDMAPETGIRLRLPGLKLVVGVERTVALRGMTSETEQQRIGSLTAAQQGLAGWRRRLPGPAIPGNIVAREAGQHSLGKREIAGNSPRECQTWCDTNHMSLTSRLPPIMARPAQLRYVSAEAQCLSATGGGRVA